MAKKKKEIAPVNKPMSPKEIQDLVDKGGRDLEKVTPVRYTPDGLNLIALYASENDTTIQAAVTAVSKKLKEFQRIDSSNEGVYQTSYSKTPAKLSDIPGKVAKYFPEGITSLRRLISEWEAVEQALYSAGILEDADPDLSELRKEIKEKDLNKRSREGKEKIAILEAGGKPAVIGREIITDIKDKNNPAIDDLVRDEKAILPYKYKLNKKVLREKIKKGDPGVLDINNALTGKAIPDFTKKPTSVDPDFNPSIKDRIQQSAGLLAEQLEADQRAGKVPVYTVIGDEKPLTPTQALQKRLEDQKKKPITPNVKNAELKQTTEVAPTSLRLFRDSVRDVINSGGADDPKINFFKSVVERGRELNQNPNIDINSDFVVLKDYMTKNGFFKQDGISKASSPSPIYNQNMPDYVRPTKRWFDEGEKKIDLLVDNNKSFIMSKTAENQTTDVISRQAEQETLLEGKEENRLEIRRKAIKALNWGAKSIPFIAPVVAGAATYLGTGSKADAAEAALETFLPIDATEVAPGELPERLRKDPEALRRAMQPQK